MALSFEHGDFTAQQAAEMSERFDAAQIASEERFGREQYPHPQQIEAQRNLDVLIVELGREIELQVPNGRNKSLALTALEDVQMRANRGIFATGASK